MRQRIARAGGLLAALALAGSAAACSDGPSGSAPVASGTTGPSTGGATASVVRVPADAPTLAEAAETVAAGGLILVSPGVYRETVVLTTPDVTLRGTDRDGVVIDGEGLRPNGVQVVADGVRVENLTVTDHTFNGVLVTGMHDERGAQAHNLSGYETLDPEEFPPLQRFSVRHVTATNNGLYGIYAFNARHGVIADNYASGSADSGFYVGQCEACDILVSGNVAERNAIGYENANASDSVLVIGNRFSGNRVGLTLISWYQEAFLPQRGITVAGNLLSDNVSADSPAQAAGGFGIGVGLAGAQDNLLTRNRIEGNPVAGVQLANTEDIPSTGNRLTGNAFARNGVDLADVSAARTPSSGTCLEPTSGLTVLPAELAAAVCPTGSAPGWSVPSSQLPVVEVPRGTPFLQVPRPRPQPQRPGDPAELPDRLPDRVDMPDPASVETPGPDLLADRAGTAASR